MKCKHCQHKNSPQANFCYNCGAQLHRNTVVSAPVSNTVSAYSIPTSGIRYFQGIGNGYLQSAAIALRNKQNFEENGFHEYTTGARVQPLKNGDWFCPDCGEKNNHNDRSCRGCGKFK